MTLEVQRQCRDIGMDGATGLHTQNMLQLDSNGFRWIQMDSDGFGCFHWNNLNLPHNMLKLASVGSQWCPRRLGSRHPSYKLDGVAQLETESFRASTTPLQNPRLYQPANLHFVSFEAMMKLYKKIYIYTIDRGNILSHFVLPSSNRLNMEAF